jgi:hypothetical protein
MTTAIESTMVEDEQESAKTLVKWLFVTIIAAWLLPVGLVAMSAKLMVALSPMDIKGGFYGFTNLNQQFASIFLTTSREANVAFIKILYGLSTGVFTALVLQYQLRFLFKYRFFSSPYKLLFSNVAKYQIGKFAIYLLGFMALSSVTMLFTVKNEDVVTFSKDNSYNSHEQITAIAKLEATSTRVLFPTGKLMMGFPVVSQKDGSLVLRFEKKSLIENHLPKGSQ